jgi:uncharacterized protein (DUF58 family)
MRHGKLLVREFETETDRGLRLLIDASLSMAYRSPEAPGAKLAYAALVGAALARVALLDSDTISLDWIGGETARPLGAMGGQGAFERLLDVLEAAQPGGDVLRDPDALDRALGVLSRRARRGAVIVVLSDFLDLPPDADERIVALSSGGRVVVGVRVLDPAETTFPFDGPIRLRSSEGGFHVETDAAPARARYLETLIAKTAATRDKFVGHGGRFVETTTTDDPVAAVRRVLSALSGATA